jgi:hypothetical protein
VTQNINESGSVSFQRNLNRVGNIYLSDAGVFDVKETLISLRVIYSGVMLGQNVKHIFNAKFNLICAVDIMSLNELSGRTFDFEVRPREQAVALVIRFNGQAAMIGTKRLPRAIDFISAKDAVFIGKQFFRAFFERKVTGNNLKNAFTGPRFAVSVRVVIERAFDGEI